MMLTVRQSSSILRVVSNRGVWRSSASASVMKLFPAVEKTICGQAAAGLMASKAFPRLVVNFWGGLSRRLPVGESANGIPANFSTFPAVNPMTVLPGDMTTCGPVALSWTTGFVGRPLAGAAMSTAPNNAKMLSMMI